MKLIKEITVLAVVAFAIACGQGTGPVENTNFDEEDSTVNSDPESGEDPPDEPE
tara:strand:+ start:852 stop:1013 length:162 start_codon:yes stop_codon:yes gene_type:complete